MHGPWLVQVALLSNCTERLGIRERAVMADSASLQSLLAGVLWRFAVWAAASGPKCASEYIFSPSCHQPRTGRIVNAYLTFATFPF